MNRYEVSVLLGKVQLGDNRYVDELVIEYWHELLGDLLTLDVALEALLRHRRDRPGVYLEPGHLLELAGAQAKAVESVPSIDDGYMESRKAQALAAAGVTEEEYAAHEHDVPWLRARFGAVLQLAPLVTYDEDGEPE